MNEGHDTSRHVWSLVRRAISPDSIARRGFAGMIREARRNRDSAETELSRDYFQWRAELLRDKAEYYCQPNVADEQRRGHDNAH